MKILDTLWYSTDGPYGTLSFVCSYKAIVAQVGDVAPWAFCLLFAFYLAPYNSMDVVLNYICCSLILKFYVFDASSKICS